MSERNAAKLQGLYVIIDPDVAEGQAEEEIARQAIEGGASLIQLRDKQRPKGAQLEVALRLKDVCGRAGIPLIINDHLD
ncbi:MAG: thiamine phosphate synthase, partial [Chloroflexota bacterium]|nr:thiamine phosphate synthase [Chloroflexota bacterium]